MPKMFIKSKLKKEKIRIEAEPNDNFVQPLYHIYEYLKEENGEHIYSYAGSIGFREVKKCSKQLQFTGL